MKRILTLFLTLFFCTVVFSQDLYERDGIVYELTGDVAMVQRIYVGNNVDIPETIEYNGQVYQVIAICKEAAYDNKDLVSVKLPDNLFSIGEFAFAYCNHLAEINLDHVLLIDESAFEGCESLTVANLKEAMVYNHAFAFCSNLQDVSLCAETPLISEGQFMECKNLKKIVLPSKLEQIEYAAFAGCSQLSEINLDQVMFIDKSAFEGCERLTEANLVKAEEVGKYAFADCFSLQNVTLCAATTTISEGQFIGCANLKKIVLPSQLEQIGNSAFAYSSLEEITIPASVSSIGEHAFYGVPLTDVKNLAIIPQNITDDTFSEYNATLHITIGTKDDYQAHNAWGRFESIVEDVLEEPILIHSNYHYNIYSNAGFAALTIEEGYHYNLTELVIPDSITYQENVYPVLGIDKKAAYFAYNLQKISLPSHLAYIAEQAFYQCIISEVVLPATLTTIGDYAFAGNNMTDVICLATVPPSCGKYVFNWSWNYDYSDYFYTPTLHVPAGYKTIYEESSDWYRFTNIVDDAEQMAAPIQVILAEQPSDDATNTYDLYGRKVNQRTKGIVIRNGKKYMK